MATSSLREMREYNLAPFWDAETQTENTLKRWLTILDYGWKWYQEYKAQAQFLEMLRPLLDKRFIVIRNYIWPEIEYPFPIILLGPPGVYLLYVTPLSGEFRIHEDRLVALGKGNKGAEVKPNLVRRTKLLGTVLEKFIAERLGIEVPVETRLVFTAPAVYVDTVDPEVKPLLPDGVKGFAEGLLKSRERLTRLHIRRLADLFLQSPEEAETKAEKEKRRAQRSEILASAQAQLRGRSEETAARPSRRRAARRGRAKTAQGPERIAGLTLKQWLILAGLMALNIILILVFIFLVATTG